MRAWAMLLGVAVVLGCGGDKSEDDDGATCGKGTHLEEGTCVPDEAEADADSDTYTSPAALWSTDRQGAIRTLRDQSDPLIQMVDLEALVKAYPGSPEEVCPVLTQEPARSWCERRQGRPHLYVKMKPRGVPSKIESTVLFRALLQPPAGVVSRLADVAPRAQDCGKDEQPDVCRPAHAVTALRKGDARRAAGICLGSGVVKWRWECAFKVAEAATKLEDSDSVVVARDLCLLSGDFARRCVEHVIVGTVVRVRKRHKVIDAAFWTDARTAATKLEEAWSVVQPAFARRLLERYWAIIVDSAYTDMHAVTGDPLDHVPADVVRHVIASASHRVVNRYQGARTTPEVLVERVRTALERRTETPPNITHSRQSEADIRHPNVRPALKIPDGLKVVVYRSDGVRPFVEDRDADILLCLLESARRMEKPRSAHASLVQWAGQQEDPVIRWAAGLP
jgi:hypothetical protein